jgi:hypothetical protein
MHAREQGALDPDAVHGAVRASGSVRAIHLWEGGFVDFETAVWVYGGLESFGVDGDGAGVLWRVGLSHWRGIVVLLTGH